MMHQPFTVFFRHFLLTTNSPASRFILDHRRLSAFLTTFCITLFCFVVQDSSRAESPMRLGMIGLDTSHAPAFAKLINQTESADDLPAMRVTAAYPGGSDDLPASYERVEGFTRQLEELGVEIKESIADLLSQVDAVLLESVDGRKHLEQVIPVFRAGKPVFIDKPLAADLTEAIAIDLIAKHYGGRWFSSSSLRFSPSIIRYRGDEYKGKIQGATAWSPCSLDPTHVDLFWYGIHGVEILYTAMGVGCEQVVRVSSQQSDVVVGRWSDGRIGTFRGIRAGASGYGLVVFGTDRIETDAKYEGYESLVREIRQFLAGGAAPVTNDETLEMMTFMQAAQVSKDNGGKPVMIGEVWQEHLAAAREIVTKIVDQL
jgi:hypothetical protein